jgi:hypothetical protein
MPGLCGDVRTVAFVGRLLRSEIGLEPAKLTVNRGLDDVCGATPKRMTAQAQSNRLAAIHDPRAFTRITHIGNLDEHSIHWHELAQTPNICKTQPCRRDLEEKDGNQRFRA